MTAQRQIGLFFQNRLFQLERVKSTTKLLDSFVKISLATPDKSSDKKLKIFISFISRWWRFHPPSLRRIRRILGCRMVGEEQGPHQRAHRPVVLQSHNSVGRPSLPGLRSRQGYIIYH